MTTLSQKSFAKGEISPALQARSDLETYQSALALCENMIVLKQGILARRSGTKFVSYAKDDARHSRLVTFQFSMTQAYVIEFCHMKLRFYKDGGIIESAPGVPYEIDAPWADVDLIYLSITQSADILYVAHGKYAPCEVRRSGHTSWEVRGYGAEKGPFEPINADRAKTVKISGTSGNIVLTAAGFTFSAADVGRLIRIEAYDYSDVPLWAGNLATSVGKQIAVGERVYLNVNGDNTGVNYPTHLGGDQISATFGVTWRYLHSGFGLAKITGVAAGGVTANATVISVSDIAQTYMPTQLISVPSWRWAMGAWNSANGWPEICGFHQQRLLFAKSTKYPNTIWASRSAEFNNHDGGENDADALFLQLASGQVNAICWLASGRTLAVGTTGREFSISASPLGAALTPTNRNALPTTNEGSAPMAAEPIDSAAIFVSSSGQRLHEFAYQYSADDYVSAELSILSDHMTRPGLRSMAWQRDPDRLIWFGTGDGSLIAMTYRRDQSVTAWHRHPTSNAFVSDITACPNSDGTGTDLWLSVMRYLNGSWRRCIEVMQPRFDGTGKADATDCWFLDCALKYSGAPATVISGLAHLEGQTVSILADGQVQPRQVVTGGAVTLSRAFSTVLVGLPYTSRVRTLSIDMQMADGSNAPRKKRIRSVSVHTLDTVGGMAGPPDDIRLLTPSGGGIMSAATPLSSETHKIVPVGRWTEAGQVELVQEDPLPFTILSITPEFDQED